MGGDQLIVVIIQQMSQINSPIKRSRDRARFSSHSYRNLRLHAALDEAGQYSQLVNSHLIRSKQQNHVLLTAQEYYEKPISRHTLAGSFSTPKLLPRKDIDLAKIKLVNPQGLPLLESFNSKAMRIPEIGDSFKAGLESEAELRQRIGYLKREINSQRKIKDKTTIRYCKLMNSDENSLARLRKLRDESFKNQILIEELINQCNTFTQNIYDTKAENQRKIAQIADNNRQVDQLTALVLDLKRHLASETNAVNQLKTQQSIAYKQMANEYMIVNQRKEQKALLLNQVSLNVHRNS